MNVDRCIGPSNISEATALLLEAKQVDLGHRPVDMGRQLDGYQVVKLSVAYHIIISYRIKHVVYPTGCSRGGGGFVPTVCLGLTMIAKVVSFSPETAMFFGRQESRFNCMRHDFLHMTELQVRIFPSGKSSTLYQSLRMTFQLLVTPCFLDRQAQVLARHQQEPLCPSHARGPVTKQEELNFRELCFC